MLHTVNMPRHRHRKKEVEEALQPAEAAGWMVVSTGAGHHWGVARCGAGCSVSVWSTPRDAGNHAKDIRRGVDRCPHGPGGYWLVASQDDDKEETRDAGA
jgi:hypothetical protein